MKLTASFGKIAARDPTAFLAWEVLQMAAIEGAQAVRLGDEVGSLEAGRPLSPTSADAVSVRRRQYDYAKVVRRLFQPGNQRPGGRLWRLKWIHSKCPPYRYPNTGSDGPAFSG